jgi:hypothetical protein
MSVVDEDVSRKEVEGVSSPGGTKYPPAEEVLIRPVIKFYNCLILRNHALVEDELWLSGSKIIDPEQLFYDRKINAELMVDCKGAIIAPGFIDVQINGMNMKK